MKKLLVLLMAALLVLAAGCAGGVLQGNRNKDVSHEVWQKGKTALEIADTFLDGTLDAKKASGDISLLIGGINDITDGANEKYPDDFAVLTSIFYLHTTIYNTDNVLSDTVEDDVVERYNDLKELLQSRK